MPEPHIDPKIEDLEPGEAGRLLLRVCSVCGLVTMVEDLDDCLSCDGYMCPEHGLVKISNWG